MSDLARVLGPESPFSSNAKHGEGEQFTRDAFDHEEEGRFEIDSFRFERYLVLGWIREREEFPYYELTVAGEQTYRNFYDAVAPDGDWWDGDED